jgi:hypothetical protein
VKMLALLFALRLRRLLASSTVCESISLNTRKLKALKMSAYFANSDSPTRKRPAFRQNVI